MYDTDTDARARDDSGRDGSAQWSADLHRAVLRGHRRPLTSPGCGHSRNKAPLRWPAVIAGVL
ncbi:hypothetical protein [Actinomadura sp. HBU206391]|uniref:hypothetical protein n=1 Tax=Actinomadura sp. HBU206391 TaxID=2731692 RepID=UPI00165060D0|nr:hypothetical protein [Actinomadura sp. HBU206391]MBC6460718.1 hypothetical protein [Actinomadura sp. HBU206391]